jgi:hypothetical protein
VATAACATALLGFVSSPAAAESSQTDVLLLVDTSGSMESALGPAVNDVNEIVDRARGELGDVEFGVAEVRDYPISTFGNAGSGTRPFAVVQAITGDKERVRSALFGLRAFGGGDLPEAYPRALRDADAGVGVGWRPGARRLVILVADDMPHDNDLNWSIPASVQISPSPYDTIADPGSDEIVGNSDDIDWQTELGQLAEHGLPLMFVLFEGREELLPYWQIWAGWTGGAAATADTANLANIVVELAHRGATAKLPYCPPGQSRDEARRCRPFWDWLGYSFQNGNLPSWARQSGLGRDDILSSDTLHRAFADIKLPSWWALWGKDPRQEMWEVLENGVCYGMALSGGRFSTGLDPQLSSAEGRSAATWTAEHTPLLPGPTVASDKHYREELLQVIAASHLAQISTEARADKWNQQEYFADQAEIGNGARAEHDELESVMSTGHGKVGSAGLASNRGVGLALVSLDHTPVGHAVVAFDLRDAADGGFQIEVWDNNRPGLASTITVHSDGTWEYPPLGWSGGPGEMTFQPEYPPRGLHLTEGGETSSGSDVTIADVPADVHGLKTRAETNDGASTDVTIQPEITDTGSHVGHTSAVVTDGSKLTLSFADKDAGATVRGSGRVLSASSLTGQGGGRVTIGYDVDAAKVTAQGEQAGELTVTRDTRRVASHGATELEMTRGGATTAKASGGYISLVLSSAVGSRLSSTTVTLRVARNSIVQVRGGLAKHAIRHGGQVAVSVRRGKRHSIVHLPTRSVASRYRLRAHVSVKGRRAKVRLSALRRLPGGTEAWVVWRASRGKKTLLRRRVAIRHPQIHRSLARTRLPGHLRGAEVKAIVHVVVNRPGPAELVSADSHRVQHGHRHRGHPGGHTGGDAGRHRHGHAHHG